METDFITTAATRIREARQIVCLTGAGISAESGVPTFREAQSGLWTRFRPEALASQAGFAADPGLVWRWYMSRLDMVEKAVPNLGHGALAALETICPEFTLITQNVDDLHERAGSRSVVHLHGNIARFRCNRCRTDHALQPDERTADEPPNCLQCGGRVRPDVVWFGEMLPKRAISRAERAVAACDLLLVVGTSGVVHPAALLPYRAKASGAFVIAVNPEYGATAETADLFLQGPGGVILPSLVNAVKAVR